MTRLWQFWRDEIDRQPIVLLVLLVFVVTCGFNASMGVATSDGGVTAWLYGSLFVAFAGLGAYAAATQAQLTSWRRAAALALVGVQLVVGQMGGWQSLGLTLEKGAAKMQDGAAQRGARVDELARLRAEQAVTKPPRPIAAIAAEEQLECSRTSATFRDGAGPKCTTLRAEKATADRAQWLAARIPALADEIAGGGRVADAGAIYAVPAALAGAVASGWAGKPVEVTAADVRFWWLVFLVAAIEVVGILGFWLFGVGHRPAPAGHHDMHGQEADPWADLRMLPAPPRRLALAAQPLTVATADHQSAPVGPVGPGGGATNIINVHSQGAQRLPPRIAARRSVVGG